MKDQEGNQIRLCDRILSALQLALAQGDLKISEILTNALEMSMTRGTGCEDFVERRTYPPEIEHAMDQLNALRERADGEKAD